MIQENKVCIKFYFKLDTTGSDKHDVMNSIWRKFFIKGTNIQVVFYIQRWINSRDR
jgi:hypothetical protein